MMGCHEKLTIGFWTNCRHHDHQIAIIISLSSFQYHHYEYGRLGNDDFIISFSLQHHHHEYGCEGNDSIKYIKNNNIIWTCCLMALASLYSGLILSSLFLCKQKAAIISFSLFVLPAHNRLAGSYSYFLSALIYNQSKASSWKILVYVMYVF